MLVVNVVSKRIQGFPEVLLSSELFPHAEGPFAYRVLVLQDGGTQKLERARISLDDCLACSGCVTSAETVLITQQSHEELQKILDANKVSGGQSLRLCCNPTSASASFSHAVKDSASPGTVCPAFPVTPTFLSLLSEILKNNLSIFRQ